MIRIAMLALTLAACSFDGKADPDGPQGDDGDDGPDAADPPGTPDGGPDAERLPPDGPSQGMCPASYTILGRYRVGSAETYTDARDACFDDADGTISGFTHLAVFGDDLERLTLFGIVDPIFDGNIWIGLRDDDMDGDYEWITNENTNGYPAGSTSLQGIPPWDNGQPSGGADSCARLKNDWLLDDRQCDEANEYLCECDSFAQP